MEIIPISGVATVLLCLISYAIPSLKVQFWMADRLGGIFQYSNTYALFLLIGLGVMLHSILENPEKTVLSKMQKWQQILMAVCLLIGILMTGCRSVLLLGIVYGFYKAILVPKMRIPVISFVAAIIVIAAIAAFALGKSQNLGRLFTIFKYNSTLWGRLLYYKDALSMMMHHPFGLGYMGYSFIQGSEQTGVYLTRYVHNDILQAGLDLGIVAMILVVIYIIFQLVKGKQRREYNKVAYNTLAYAAAIDGDVSAVIENGDHVLKLNRYDTGQYVRYIMLLQDLLQNCSEEDYKLITERINELPAELASLESETSKLAYMTRDVPVFTIQ